MSIEKSCIQLNLNHLVSNKEQNNQTCYKNYK